MISAVGFIHFALVAIGVMTERPALFPEARVGHLVFRPECAATAPLRAAQDVFEFLFSHACQTSLKWLYLRNNPIATKFDSLVKIFQKNSQMIPESSENGVPSDPHQTTEGGATIGKSGKPLRTGKRPSSCKRVGFALGQDGQDRMRRITNALKIHTAIDLSRSEVLRVILELVEESGLRAGDVVLRKSVEIQTSTHGHPPTAYPDPPDSFSLMLWSTITHRVSEPKDI